MIRKFSKTIFIIVFVVFLGINNVNAEICTYSDSKDTITIELDDNGKLVDIKWNGGILGVTFNYNYCPNSIYIQDEDRTIYSGTSTRTPTYTKVTSGSNETNKNGNKIGDGIGALEKNESLVSCGTLTDLPAGIPNVTKIIYNIIQVVVPIILIIYGLLDLARAIMAQKEDEIKKGQQTFIKRLITAAIVFLVFILVKMVASYFSDNSSVVDCLNCFIKGECSENKTEEEDNPNGEEQTFVDNQFLEDLL